jgi:Fic-DOC domain mobile mystery protein B
MKGSDAPGATPLDPDEEEGLRLAHVHTRAELNAAEQENIAAGTEWLSSVRVRSRFDRDLLWELHKRMFGEVWKWAGQPRATLKNIGVPPERIRTNVAGLLSDTEYQIASKTLPLREIATRFHHRLVSIHAFPNGNGRHARLLTDHLCRVHDHPPPTWSDSALQQDGQARDAYIRSLKAADRGEMQQLQSFMWN